MLLGPEYLPCVKIGSPPTSYVGESIIVSDGRNSDPLDKIAYAQISIATSSIFTGPSRCEGAKPHESDIDMPIIGRIARRVPSELGRHMAQKRRIGIARAANLAYMSDISANASMTNRAGRLEK